MSATLAILAALTGLLPLTLGDGDYGNYSTSAKPISVNSSGIPIPPFSTHIVNVGMSGLFFSPDNLNVSVGDSVEFRFFPLNHSVAQSSFSAPCAPAGPRALFSGFFPVQSDGGRQRWTIQINDTKPIWLYCSQGPHCQMGMVAVINPPPDQSIGRYKQAAANATANMSPKDIQGGITGSASPPNVNSSGVAPEPTGSGTRSVPFGGFTLFLGLIFILIVL
ncbi:hypothetical protein GP486_001937 [Trichoglossum hirsutum]|uniref:Cupredoxin n=1 Tax=Trichoglossum hirsutum TaxID=265104 RepID=A0A9P8LG13_9PEZI|nr:hypothetical protein GP486_001937 [Trichoglossum hirsutum]